MTRKIAIVGSGKVGTALGKGISQVGHEIRFAKRGQIAATASWSDIIVVAVPFRAIRDVVGELGQTADGKAVIDVTNSLTDDLRLALGFTTSGAEELQKQLPRAYVVKAFNTVFADHMSTGRVKGHQITSFVAADDGDIRKTVLEIARAIGFDAVDAGPLKNARSLESMAFLNIQLGWIVGYGSDVGFSFIH
jgi:predicted dinucleotide-binding enzyme